MDFIKHQTAPNEPVKIRRAHNGIKEELPPSEADVERAIMSLRENRAGGCDNISPEMFKAGGKHLVKGIHRLISQIWREETVPEDWRRSLILPVYKKGDKYADLTNPDNYRGIFLLSVGGKAYANILLERLVAEVNVKISEMQSDFRTRGCADQILTLQRLVEQARDKKASLYMCFLELNGPVVKTEQRFIATAYNTIERENIWSAVEEYGASSKLCRLIKALYAGYQAGVQVNGTLSKPFEIKTGLRIGCLLSPTLFNVFIDRLVRKALTGMKAGVRVEYLQSDGRTNLGDQACESVLLFDMMYADDTVVISESVDVLKESLVRLKQATKVAGIITKKTKYLITKVNDQCEPEEELFEM